MPAPIRTIPVGSLPRPGFGETVAFGIPGYQRGYRWKAEDVSRLLDDLAEFIEEGESGRPFYCLQPLVVKKSNQIEWEVVDGQQRLTTLYLIWKFLNGTAPYNLSYQTRARSREFLDAISEKAQCDVTNIDFHHIFHAHRAIREWFQGDENKKEDFRSLLSDATTDGRNVRFIWYELGQQDDAVAAFTRLNVGKIPLTDEELIRALFLRHPNGGALAESAYQHRLALEWDRIEAALQAPDFWGFLSRRPPQEGGRISLLLELCAPEGMATTDRGIFQHFEAKLRQAGPEDLRSEWQRIVSRFEQLEEWHDDPVAFHLVGILATIAVGGSGDPLRRLLKEAAEKPKQEFVSGIRNEIRSKLVGDAKTISEFVGKLDYHENARSIRPTLALFNIATLLRTQGVQFRFPFHLYHQNQWDVEHVQSQAGDGLGDDKRQREWLAACEVELGAEPDAGCLKTLEQIKQFLDKTTTLAFEDLEKSIRKCFDESDSTADLHGIGNLTLLDCATNRAYGNAPFVVKRAKVLDAERQGTFLLPCTRNLFLKVYSKAPGNLRRWDLENDGASHETAIVETLEEFFIGTGGATL